jgi:hypothetical protein
MRNGKLLVEDNPDILLKKFRTNLLEDIVMKLCLNDSGQNEDEDDEGSGGGNLTQVKIQAESDGNKSALEEFSSEEQPDRRTTISIMDWKPTKKDGDVGGDISIEKTPNNWRKLHRASVVAELRDQPQRLEEIQDSYNRFSTMCYKNVLTLVRNIT